MHTWKKAFSAFIFFSLVAGFLTVADASAPRETLKFWASGYAKPMRDWLQKEVFPKFEQEHNVTIEFSNVDWSVRPEKLLRLSMEAGLNPAPLQNWQEMLIRMGRLLS